LAIATVTSIDIVTIATIGVRGLTVTFRRRGIRRRNEERADNTVATGAAAIIIAITTGTDSARAAVIIAVIIIFRVAIIRIREYVGVTGGSRLGSALSELPF